MMKAPRNLLEAVRMTKEAYKKKPAKCKVQLQQNCPLCLFALHKAAPLSTMEHMCHRECGECVLSAFETRDLNFEIEAGCCVWLEENALVDGDIYVLYRDIIVAALDDLETIIIENGIEA